MYPSNSYYVSNNTNNVNLISPTYTLDQISPNKPSIYEINPNSKQEDPLHPPFYYNIPSPHDRCENNDVYDLFLYQPQIIEMNAEDPIRTGMVQHLDNIEEMLGECSSKKNKKSIKRSSKKDRHSKIETAQGLRDRRMRLSLQVARDFFDLQEMLGYSKASKTVEWLLSKSEAAIKDLTRCSTSANTSFSTSFVVPKKKVDQQHLVNSTKEAKNVRGSTRKSAFNPLAKETREKARIRARDRTREKRKGNVPKIGFETTMSHQMNQLEPWCRNENYCSQLQIHDEARELSSSMIFDHGVSQEHQFTDIDLHGKPWNAYKNTNLH